MRLYTAVFPVRKASDERTPVSVQDVLVIDDNYLAGFALAGILQRLGYRVSLAGGRQGGLEVVRYVRPQIVFIDITVDGIDKDIELAREIVGVYGLKTIFVTGHSAADLRGRLAEFEQSPMVFKPVDERAVRAVLATEAGYGPILH